MQGLPTVGSSGYLQRQDSQPADSQVLPYSEHHPAPQLKQKKLRSAGAREPLAAAPGAQRRRVASIMAKHSTKRVATEREAMVTCMTKTQQQAATSRHVSA
jgi:hypothetical protein